MRLRLFILCVALFALVINAGCSNSNKPAVERGQILPEMTLISTEGAPYSLPSASKGKLTIVLFWSQGCHYCKKEMPLIEPIYEKYKASGFEFVAVHTGPGMEAARQLKKDMGLSFPIVVDEDFSAKDKYGVRAVPSMYVLSREGKLKERILGGLGASDIEKLIREEGI